MDPHANHARLSRDSALAPGSASPYEAPAERTGPSQVMVLFVVGACFFALLFAAGVGVAGFVYYRLQIRQAEVQARMEAIRAQQARLVDEMVRLEEEKMNGEIERQQEKMKADLEQAFRTRANAQSRTESDRLEDAD